MNKCLIEVALPIYNEEKELFSNTIKLYTFLKKNFGGGNFLITIADNASTDNSPDIGRNLTIQYKEINYKRINHKGRGRAIKYIWKTSKADVMIYMDIDLSTDLDSLPKLFDAIKNKHYDLAVGSRLMAKSKIYNRPLFREILSRGLNILIKILFQTKFTDAQCGFKAIGQKTKKILDLVQDNEWFFDSELLIIAEKNNMRLFETPIIWVDNPGSTVRVIGTVIGDLKGLLRLFFTRPWMKDIV